MFCLLVSATVLRTFTGLAVDLYKLLNERAMRKAAR